MYSGFYLVGTKKNNRIEYIEHKHTTTQLMPAFINFYCVVALNVISLDVLFFKVGFISAFTVPFLETF